MRIYCTHNATTNAIAWHRCAGCGMLVLPLRRHQANNGCIKQGWKLRWQQFWVLQHLCRQESMPFHAVENSQLYDTYEYLTAARQSANSKGVAGP